MGPQPEESRSSGSNGRLTSVIVICLVALGVVILVVLGALFWTVAVVLEPQRAGRVLGDAQPGRMLAAVPDHGQPDSTSVVPTSPGGDLAQTDSGAVPGDDTKADASEDVPARRLAAIAPAEVLDVQTGEEPLARPVQISGRSYPAAIWAQPTLDLGSSQVSYSLDPCYRRLSGMAAIDDSLLAEEAPSAAFRIYGDGNLLWDSGTVSGAGASHPFVVEVGEVRLLALVVESGSPARISRFVWADMNLE